MYPARVELVLVKLWARKGASKHLERLDFFDTLKQKFLKHIRYLGSVLPGQVTSFSCRARATASVRPFTPNFDNKLLT
jgi:hypothetical protein